MNTPIIDPIWLYVIDTIDNLLTVLGIIAVVSGVISFFALGGLIDFDFDNEIQIRILKYFKITVIIFITSVTLRIFIPSSNTIIKMLVAKNITYEKVEQLGHGIKEIKNELKKDVLDIITAIKKGG